MLGTILINSANATLYFLFYSAFLQKGVGYKRDWWKLTVYVITISLYTLFSKGYIVEPFRVILMLIINWLLFCLLLENKKAANITVVLMSYIICAGIWFVSILVVRPVTYFAMPFIANEEVKDLLVIPVYLLAGILFYNEARSRDFLALMKAIEVQVFTCILSVFFLTIYFYFKLRANFQSVGTDNIIFLILFLCIIMGLSILAFYQIKRYRERTKLQSANTALQSQNEILEKIRIDLASQIHTQKKVIPTYMNTFNRVLEGMSPEELKKTLEEYGDTLIELNRIYLGERISAIKQRQKQMKLPETSWLTLNNYFAECNNRAIKAGVSLKFYIMADVSILDNLGVSQLDVMKVFADHMDNTFKEIAKTERNGIIKVYFKSLGEGDGFEIRIEDNAHEFGLNILADLGTRGVSSNGTGDGFANTLSTLALYDASLTIREYAPADECSCNKGLSIRFDGKNQFIIQSYRADAIRELTTNSNLMIEQTRKKTDNAPQQYEVLNKALDLINED